MFKAYLSSILILVRLDELQRLCFFSYKKYQIECILI